MKTLRDHPQCISGKNCKISVAGQGAFLSRLCPIPYCIPCFQAKYPDRAIPVPLEKT